MSLPDESTLALSVGKPLLGKDENDYAGSYASDLLELYRLYVESAEKVSDRRQSANSFYLTLSTAVVTALGAFLHLESGPLSFPEIFVGFSVVGLAVSFLWRRSISSYRKLNDAKFRVIHQVEEFLPVKLYHAEWAEVGMGKDKRRYRPFTEVEIAVPWVFIVMHFVVLFRFVPLVVLGQDL